MILLVPTELEAGRLFGEQACSALSDTCVGAVQLGEHRFAASICGFGLAASGVAAAHALAAYDRLREQAVIRDSSPSHAIVVGIAGTYDPERAPVGSAMLATEVGVYGIGMGRGKRLARRSAGEQAPPWIPLPADGEWVPLCVPEIGGPPVSEGRLLSVAAATGSPAEAQAISAAHPGVLAEDMEAFSVALAVHYHDVPLTVVRGISNVVGELDKAKWRIDDALDAARDLLVRVVQHLGPRRKV